MPRREASGLGLSIFLSPSFKSFGFCFDFGVFFFEQQILFTSRDSFLSLFFIFYTVIIHEIFYPALFTHFHSVQHILLFPLRHPL